MSVSLAIMSAAASGMASAAGFALIENSASGMGNAYAGGAAGTKDASTVYFNPAGMSYLEGDQVVMVGHYIVPTADFTNEGSTAMQGTPSPSPLTGDDDGSNHKAFVPNAYIVKSLGNGGKFGFGLNAPFGLTTEYNDDWVGRYHGVRSAMKTININPAYSFRMSDDVALGLGVNAQYVNVELSSAVDFGSICALQELGGVLPAGTCTSAGLAPQQSDGFAVISGEGWSYGANLGLIWDINPKARFGFAYRSAVKHDVDGDAEFSVPVNASFMTASGYFTDTGAEASVTLPASTSLSLHYAFDDKTNIMADATLTQWSSFDELRVVYDSTQPDSVTTEDWQDSWRIAVGGDYRYSGDILFRAGVAYDQTPVADAEHRTVRVPDSDRTWISVGLGYRYSKNINIDAGYAHLIINDAKIDNTTEGALAHTITGSYEASVDIVSVQLTYEFQ
ncbi:MAG: outer membrane protein transport protein [Gammaproteobacteria bacterium]|nr:outer membrane protein transport protein [Gammaproteobacteria bacterium]